MAREKKFTSETVAQIRNLVENGKSRQDIAEQIGVTIGSLQVTCSRLGISLRRSRRDFDDAGSAPAGRRDDNGPQLTIEPNQSPRLGPTGGTGPVARRQLRTGDVEMARFAIQLRYGGEERTTDLPFTQDMISRLALEAESRDMKIGALLSELVVGTIRKELLQSVLPPGEAAAPKEEVRKPGRANESAPTATTAISEVSDRRRKDSSSHGP
jgi:hypothetical protein